MVVVLFFFFKGGGGGNKAEIISPCQHLLCSARVHDFECSDAYGMWHALVSSEWLRALGKQLPPRTLAERKEKRGRGSVANTIYISGGWAHSLLCKWELRRFIKRIIRLVISERWRKHCSLLVMGIEEEEEKAALLIICKSVNISLLCKCCFFF